MSSCRKNDFGINEVDEEIHVVKQLLAVFLPFLLLFDDEIELKKMEKQIDSYLD